MEHVAKEDVPLTQSVITGHHREVKDGVDDDCNDRNIITMSSLDNEQALADLVAEQEPLRERLHGVQAITVGYHVGIF